MRHHPKPVAVSCQSLYLVTGGLRGYLYSVGTRSGGRHGGSRSQRVRKRGRDREAATVEAEAGHPLAATHRRRGVCLELQLCNDCWLLWLSAIPFSSYRFNVVH